MQLSQLTEKELINHANCQSDLTELESALIQLIERDDSDLEEEVNISQKENDDMIKAMEDISTIVSEFL